MVWWVRDEFWRLWFIFYSCQEKDSETDYVNQQKIVGNSTTKVWSEAKEDKKKENSKSSANSWDPTHASGLIVLRCQNCDMQHLSSSRFIQNISDSLNVALLIRNWVSTYVWLSMDIWKHFWLKHTGLFRKSNSKIQIKHRVSFNFARWGFWRNWGSTQRC